MLEIKITVSCPDLIKAATIFASAMPGAKSSGPAAGDVSTPAAPVTQTVPVNSVPVNPANGHPLTTVPSYPSNAAPVTAAPVAQAPTFTLEQVSKAGADLVTAQPAKMQELMNLLSQYGVQTVNALRQDQLGAFATALRGMGAQI